MKRPAHYDKKGGPECGLVEEDMQVRWTAPWNSTIGRREQRVQQQPPIIYTAPNSQYPYWADSTSVLLLRALHAEVLIALPRCVCDGPGNRAVALEERTGELRASARRKQDQASLAARASAVHPDGNFRYIRGTSSATLPEHHVGHTTCPPTGRCHIDVRNPRRTSGFGTLKSVSFRATAGPSPTLVIPRSIRRAPRLRVALSARREAPPASPIHRTSDDPSRTPPRARRALRNTMNLFVRFPAML